MRRALPLLLALGYRPCTDALALEAGTTPVFRPQNEALRDPERVMRIDLSDPRPSTFPREIQRFRYPREFRLRNGGLTSLPEEIGKVRGPNLLAPLPAPVLAVVNTAIRSVRQDDVLIFAASVITVSGVAFFAEMSMLSNIIAFLVPFFQHPIKVGDRVRLKDGDVHVVGGSVDISYFLSFVGKTDGGVVSVPNASLLQDGFTKSGPYHE